VFVSDATNLANGDKNNLSDVFLADVQTGVIELVSRSVAGGSGGGASTNPAISDNGDVVVFQSEASNLVCRASCDRSLDDINLLWDIFVFDRRSRGITCLSRDPKTAWMEPSVGPAISGDGTLVAFSSRHPIDSNDVANDFDLFITEVKN
jgi:Tol biopolymer transport system component